VTLTLRASYGSYWLGIKIMIACWKACSDPCHLKLLYPLNRTVLTWGRNAIGRPTSPWVHPTDTLSRAEATVTMTPATVFDWNHSTKGILWRSNCVKHHVEPRADFWVNILGAGGEMPSKASRTMGSPAWQAGILGGNSHFQSNRFGWGGGIQL